MPKVLVAMVPVLALALTVGAQTKISGKAHCPKAESNSQDVGDKPGHMIMLQKTTCTYTAPLEIAGAKTKDELDVFTTDMSGAMGHDNGYGTDTMDNGDKFTVRFSGSSKMSKDNTGAFSGKWSFVSGTGKVKGIRGGGTYKGTMGADGSSDFDVEGDYTIPEKPAAPAKKAPKEPM